MGTYMIGRAFALFLEAIKTDAGTTEDDGIAMRGFEEFVRWCHEAQVKAGWWTDLQTGERKERNRGQLIALMHSEVSEAIEADRKNLLDDKLPLRKGVEVELGDALIRIADFVGSLGKSQYFADSLVEAVVQDCNLRIEERNSDPFADIHFHLSKAYENVSDDDICVLHIADAARAIFGFAAKRDLDLSGAVRDKMEYNARRADHKIENRKAEGGKAY